MKIANLLFLFLFISLTVVAQTNYTYVTDRQFIEPNELYGYTLVPNEWEDASGSHGKLRPGEIAFSITRGYLMVKGGEAAGSYGISRIEKESKRIMKVHTLDSKDPSKQGSLKIVFDDNQNIDAYIFRRSRNHDEIIYYQAGLSSSQKQKDKQFFTNRNQLVFEDDSQIWGNTIRPHFVLTRSKCNRLYIKDDVSIEFIEDIEIKEKPVKEVLTKTPKKKKQEEVVATAEEDLFEDELDDLEDDETTGADIGFFRVMDDEKEVPEDEEFESDFPTAEETPAPKAQKAKQKKEKAPKEKRTYSMVYRYNAQQDGGAVDIKEEVYTIKKWKRLTSQHGGDRESRYVITLTTNVGDIMLYLNERNAVSMIELGGNRYLMKGY